MLVTEDEFRPSGEQEQPEDPQVAPIFGQNPMDALLGKLFHDREQTRDQEDQVSRINEILEEIMETAGDALPDDAKHLDYDANFAEQWRLPPYQTAQFSEANKTDHATRTRPTGEQLEVQMQERIHPTFNKDVAMPYSLGTILDTFVHLLPIIVGATTVRSIIHRIRGTR